MEATQDLGAWLAPLLDVGCRTARDVADLVALLDLDTLEAAGFDGSGRGFARRTVTALECSECDGGKYASTDDGRTGVCTVCGDVRDVAWDIVRHLDFGESVVVSGGLLAVVAAPDLDDTEG